jgi:hypothetical protein
MFSKGFITGFAGSAAQDIKKKKDEADTFFQDQMQLARTRGLKNRDLTKQVVDGHVMTAKQLEAMGVPKDLVMSIAKQNPDDMSAIMTTIQGLQKDGVTPDEAFYRDLIKTSGDFKAPDEDYSTFINNLYSPLRANVKADKEAFNDDKRGGLWATMMGTNAMDMASGRLEDTIIMDGMSAADLNRYSDTPTPNTQGAPTVNMDFGLIGNAEREAADRLSGGNPLKIPDVKNLNEAFEASLNEASLAIQKEWNDAHPDDKETEASDIPGHDQAITAMAIQDMIDQGYGEWLMEIPKIREYYEATTEEQPLGDDAAPAEGAITTPDPTAAVPEVPSPENVPGVEGDVIATPPNFPKTLNNGAVLKAVHSDGTSTWLYPDGTEMVHDNKEIEQSQKPAMAPMDVQDILRNPTGN